VTWRDALAEADSACACMDMDVSSDSLTQASGCNGELHPRLHRLLSHVEAVLGRPNGEGGDQPEGTTAHREEGATMRGEHRDPGAARMIVKVFLV
jgi:hypothetical protein